MAFGELKESEPVGRPAKGRREEESFHELTYKLNFLFDFERIEEHPVCHFLFL